MVDGEALAEAGAGSDAALKAELETCSLGEAAAQAYASAREFLPKVRSGLERCADRLGSGQVGSAMEDLAMVCQGVSWFFDLMGSLGPLLGEEVHDWTRDAEDLQALLLRTEEAISQEDWVLVCDQLRYEWMPRLHAWADRLPAQEAEAASRLLPKP